MWVSTAYHGFSFSSEVYNLVTGLIKLPLPTCLRCLFVILLSFTLKRWILGSATSTISSAAVAEAMVNGHWSTEIIKLPPHASYFLVSYSLSSSFLPLE